MIHNKGEKDSMPAEVRKLDEQRKINVELTPEQLQMLQRLIDLEQQENKDKEQFEEKRKIIISSSFIVTTCQN